MRSRVRSSFLAPCLCLDIFDNLSIPLVYRVAFCNMSDSQAIDVTVEFFVATCNKVAEFFVNLGRVFKDRLVELFEAVKKHSFSIGAKSQGGYNSVPSADFGSQLQSGSGL